MTKYIRLEDRIVKINAEDNQLYYFDRRKNFVYKDDNYRVSEDLKDLIDVYLIENKEYGHVYVLKSFEDVINSIQKYDVVHGCIVNEYIKPVAKLTRRGKLKCL